VYSVQTQPEIWKDALEGLSGKIEANRELAIIRLEQQRTNEDQCAEMQKALNSLRKRCRDYEREKNQLDDETDAVIEIANILLAEKTSLAEELATLKKKNATLQKDLNSAQSKLRVLRLGSASENPEHRSSSTLSNLEMSNLPIRSGMPANPAENEEGDGEAFNNAKFPDAPMFDGDRDKYAGWKLKVAQKLRNSRKQYPTQQSRIDYITSRCTGDAEDPIVWRSDPEGENPYMTEAEVWHDLDNAFGDADKVYTAEMKLENKDFPMKNSETFDQFLTRFTATTNKIPHLNEPLKIRLLRRMITKTLQRKITGLESDSLGEIITKVRRHDLEIRRIKEQDEPVHKGTKRKQEDVADNQSEKRGKFYRFRGKNDTKRTPEIREKLKKLNACWKCGQVGHKHFEDDAPCKDKAATPNDQLKLATSSSETEKAKSST